MKNVNVFVNYEKKDTVLTFSKPSKLYYGETSKGKGTVERIKGGRLACKLEANGYTWVGGVKGFDLSLLRDLKD